MNTFVSARHFRVRRVTATSEPVSSQDPRSYPAGVTLVKRSARGAASAPDKVTIAEIEEWLLHGATLENDMLTLMESFIWRMIASGLPIDRASLHITTLHPQLLGFAWNWRRADGFCDEVKVLHSATDSDSFKRNTLARVIETKECLRRNPQLPEAQSEFPIMRELAELGIHDYLAIPFGGGEYRHIVTLATARASGFAERDIEQITHLLRLFALHVERHIAARIAENALNAYLGTVAGVKVLAGSIQRGSGEAIRAIIWVSDLRGFTDLSSRLSGAEMIMVLNAYFETLAGAVLSNGGEVLKFMGDGLLAVFPIGADDQRAAAAKAALIAAQQAVQGLDRLNAQSPPPLNLINGWNPLRSGIALHEGEVFFGNIGAPDRLDFTVIGSAVNETSRVEALQKTLHRDILITEAVARHLDVPLDDLGQHSLRGVAAPLAIFSPARS
jgi:adenylate cyclase